MKDEKSFFVLLPFFLLKKKGVFIMTDQEREALREKMKQRAGGNINSTPMSSNSEKPELQKWLPFIMGFGGCLFCVLLVVAGIGIGKRLNKPDSENKKVAEATLDEFETESTTEETTETTTEATTEVVTEATTEATTAATTEEPKQEYTEANCGGLKFKYPSDWSVENVENGMIYMPPDTHSERFMVSCSEAPKKIDYSKLSDDELQVLATELATSNLKGSDRLVDFGVNEFKGYTCCWNDMETEINNQKYMQHSDVIFCNGKMYFVMNIYNESLGNTHEKDCEKIKESMTFEGDGTEAGAETKKKSSSEKKTADVKKSEKKSTKDTMTAGQRNAVQKMKDYLEYTSFSEQGMRKQLAYEGFSDADIDYAIEHNPVDWYEQAIKKAKDYLKYSSFSKERLIKQLEYEGFTSEQAQCGADAAYQ